MFISAFLGIFCPLGIPYLIYSVSGSFMKFKSTWRNLQIFSSQNLNNRVLVTFLFQIPSSPFFKLFFNCARFVFKDGFRKMFNESKNSFHFFGLQSPILFLFVLAPIFSCICCALRSSDRGIVIL
jgi:hypothetical protein